MSVAVEIRRPARLPADTVEVRPGGLLAHVHRPCPEHGHDGSCVARSERDACLVFWCASGEHHFTVR